MLAERLRMSREAKGWIQAELAERSGFSRNSIINWETAKRTPTANDLQKLATILEVSVAYLMGETDNPVSSQYFDVEKLDELPENIRKVVFEEATTYYHTPLSVEDQLLSSKDHTQRYIDELMLKKARLVQAVEAGALDLDDIKRRNDLIKQDLQTLSDIMKMLDKWLSEFKARFPDGPQVSLTLMKGFIAGVKVTDDSIEIVRPETPPLTDEEYEQYVAPLFEGVPPPKVDTRLDAILGMWDSATKEQKDNVFRALSGDKQETGDNTALKKGA